jgi:selenocysteine lyase/cysteine desulfurase
MDNKWAIYRKDILCDAQLIHFNNAGTGLMPKPVLEAMTDYLYLEAQIGGYEAFDRLYPRFEKLYHNLATLLGASPQEIALFENATKAWQAIFYGIDFRPGDLILTGPQEYGSNLMGLYHRKKCLGIELEMIPQNESGEISLDRLENMIKKRRPKLLVITHIPSQGGIVNPIKEIGKLANRYNTFYLLDATQSVGHLDIDVKKIQCDALCGTGRKFLRGPRGTGFVYLKEDRLKELSPPMLDMVTVKSIEEDYSLNNKVSRMETWETNFAGRLGLSIAIEYALKIGIKNIEGRVCTLASKLREKLQSIEGIRVYDQHNLKSAIVTFKVLDKCSKQVSEKLLAKKINVNFLPYERFPLDFKQRQVSDLLRASVHYYNLDREIDLFCEELFYLR